MYAYIRPRVRRRSAAEFVKASYSDTEHQDKLVSVFSPPFADFRLSVTLKVSERKREREIPLARSVHTFLRILFSKLLARDKTINDRRLAGWCGGGDFALRSVSRAHVQIAFHVRAKTTTDTTGGDRASCLSLHVARYFVRVSRARFFELQAEMPGKFIPFVRASLADDHGCRNAGDAAFLRLFHRGA